MRSLKNTSAIFFIIVTSLAAQALQVGDVVLSGNGCYGSKEMVAVEGQDSRFEAPVRVKIVKKKEASFGRKVCNMRVPIALTKNEKLQIINVSQSIKVVVGQGGDVRSNLTVSFLGTNAEPLIFDVKSHQRSKALSQILKSEGVVAESDCGKNAMLIIDFNVVASGAAKVSASSGGVLLTLKTLSCN
jgi:hypothetical protein